MTIRPDVAVIMWMFHRFFPFLSVPLLRHLNRKMAAIRDESIGATTG
jgi:hypothetical protein